MHRSTFLCDSVQLSVARTGEGKPFVFQHGLSGDASQTAEVFPVDFGFTCLTLECRGHGLSDSGEFEQFSISRFAEDVAAFIDSLNVGPVPVGGISMGAAIALRLAVVRPDLVSALVIARPAWIDQPSPENLTPIREVAELLASREPAQALLEFRSSVTAKKLEQDAPDNLDSLSGFFGRTRIAETQALLAAIASDGPDISRKAMGALECATLVIGTKRDSIHPLKMAQDLANLIPKARFVEITPKADGIDMHQNEFRGVLGHFIEEIK